MSDQQERRYGEWAGNPKGVSEDVTRCVQNVWPANGWYSHQCLRKRGYGKDGLYCKQHAKSHPAEEDRINDE